MQFFREEHVRGARHLAGHRYSESAAPKKTYINFISLYCNIIGRNLFAKNPRCSLSTFEMGQKATVDAMETWINQEIEHIGFAETMQKVVLNALFSIGIVKVGLASAGDAASVGWGLEAGSPCVWNIELDDFVFDHRANTFLEADYIGHRFSAPLEAIEDSKIYNKKARDRLVAREYKQYNREGDERIREIGRSHKSYEDEFVKKVDLWEFYLPKHGLICVVAEDDLSGIESGWDYTVEPLRADPWLGPKTGPYHILAYQNVPGNPFPKGPVQDIVELHEAMNESYRKLVSQAANQKDVTVCQMQNQEDGERIRKSRNLDIVPLMDPKSVAAISMNGINANQHLFFREMFDRASLMAGNLITMGGLAPQAGTLGQEELLATQSNGQVASMQDTTSNFVSKVMKSLCWFWWYDPQKVMKSKYDKLNVPGVEIVREVHPWDSMDPMALRRAGEMPEIRVDPYSMRYQTPQQRASSIMEILTKVWAPFAQLAERQGVVPDFPMIFELLGKYKDDPNMQAIYKIAEPPTQETLGSGASHEGTMAPETTRNYNRHDVGGESKRNDSAEMETMLEADAGAQPSNGQLIEA